MNEANSVQQSPRTYAKTLAYLNMEGDAFEPETSDALIEAVRAVEADLRQNRLTRSKLTGSNPERDPTGQTMGQAVDAFMDYLKTQSILPDGSLSPWGKTQVNQVKSWRRYMSIANEARNGEPVLLGLLETDLADLTIAKAQQMVDSIRKRPLTFESKQTRRMTQKLPHVMLDGPFFENQPFMIDTGSIEMQSGTIDSMTFTQNVVHGESTELPSSLSINARSTRSVKKAIFKKASIGGHECRELIMKEGNEQRILSLRFLTRFNATFDFPRNTLYLEKSRHFDRPDRFDLSGLHFLRRNGKVVVEVVDDGSPAALVGVKAGDNIISVNGDDASKARLFTVRETLSLPGTTVHVKLRRGSEIVEIDLELPEKKSQAEGEVVELREPEVFPAN